MNTCFAFDLDGTITSEEILPLIATELNLQSEMSLLTALTLKGVIPFSDSFRLRCAILKSIPISVVQEIVSTVNLNQEVVDFIQKNKPHCYVVTANLIPWIKPLIDKLECKFFGSTAITEGDTLIQIEHILNKSEAILNKDIQKYERVVAIGDSFNDIPMFEVADIGVSYGGVHSPVEELVNIANFYTPNGRTLCRLLNTL